MSVHAIWYSVVTLLLNWDHGGLPVKSMGFGKKVRVRERRKVQEISNISFMII